MNSFFIVWSVCHSVHCFGWSIIFFFGCHLFVLEGLGAVNELFGVHDLLWGREDWEGKRGEEGANDLFWEASVWVRRGIPLPKKVTNIRKPVELSRSLISRAKAKQPNKLQFLINGMRIKYFSLLVAFRNNLFHWCRWAPSSNKRGLLEQIGARRSGNHFCQ